jgi:hypothetical protein
MPGSRCFRADGDLGQDDAGARVQGREQVHLTAVRAASSPQGLAVHSDHHPVAPAAGHDRPGTSTKPGGQDRGEHSVVEADQQPPHRRAGRHATGEPEPGAGAVVQVVQPVGDRRERRRTGQHGTDRDREQAGEGITHSARVTRVRDLGQRLQQPTAFTVGDRRGGDVGDGCRYGQCGDEG